MSSLAIWSRVASVACTAPVRVEGANADVQRGGGVPDQDLGGIGRGNAVDRRELGKPGQDGGRLPLGFVEPAIDPTAAARRGGVTAVWPVRPEWTGAGSTSAISSGSMARRTGGMASRVSTHAGVLTLP